MPLTPRQQVEQQLASLEGSYSGWLGATGIGRYRSGTQGLDRLNDFEAPVEASIAAGRAVRLTAVALPVFLSSGTLNPSSFSASNVPYLGTLAANTANLAGQQYANGIGGQLQSTAKDVGVAIGYTPYNFPVRNLMEASDGVRWAEPFHCLPACEPVKDTQLSYAGLHDPGAFDFDFAWTRVGRRDRDHRRRAAGFWRRRVKLLSCRRRWRADRASRAQQQPVRRRDRRNLPGCELARPWQPDDGWRAVRDALHPQ